MSERMYMCRSSALDTWWSEDHSKFNKKRTANTRYTSSIACLNACIIIVAYFVAILVCYRPYACVYGLNAYNRYIFSLLIHLIRAAAANKLYYILFTFCGRLNISCTCFFSLFLLSNSPNFHLWAVLPIFITLYSPIDEFPKRESVFLNWYYWCWHRVNCLLGDGYFWVDSVQYWIYHQLSTNLSISGHSNHRRSLIKITWFEHTQNMNEILIVSHFWLILVYSRTPACTYTTLTLQTSSAV